VVSNKGAKYNLEEEIFSRKVGEGERKISKAFPTETLRKTSYQFLSLSQLSKGGWGKGGGILVRFLS